MSKFSDFYGIPKDDDHNFLNNNEAGIDIAVNIYTSSVVCTIKFRKFGHRQNCCNYP